MSLQALSAPSGGGAYCFEGTAGVNSTVERRQGEAWVRSTKGEF